jgi:hypothetical protein
LSFVAYCSEYSYHFHGLTCISNIPIPVFRSEGRSSTPPDLILTIDSQPPGWVREAQKLASSVRYSDAASTVIALGGGQFFQLAYNDGAQFVVDAGGQRLWAGSAVPLTLDYLATYLRGPVMGFVLRRRNITALHASAVYVGGQAIVLCGESEAGKSTTAAALALRGAPVLCDDICALRETDGSFQVESGDPQVGLWPDSVRNLLGNPEALPRVTADWEKRYLHLDGQKAKFEPQSRPLSAIYFLAARVTQHRAPYVETLGCREALLQMVQNTYMNWILDRQQRIAEFDMLSRMVMQVPSRRLTPHADPLRIQDLCDLILEDVNGLFRTPNPASVASGD